VVRDGVVELQDAEAQDRRPDMAVPPAEHATPHHTARYAAQARDASSHPAVERLEPANIAKKLAEDPSRSAIRSAQRPVKDPGPVAAHDTDALSLADTTLGPVPAAETTLADDGLPLPSPDGCEKSEPRHETQRRLQLETAYARGGHDDVTPPPGGRAPLLPRPAVKPAPRDDIGKKHPKKSRQQGERAPAPTEPATSPAVALPSPVERDSPKPERAVAAAQTAATPQYRMDSVAWQWPCPPSPGHRWTLVALHVAYALHAVFDVRALWPLLPALAGLLSLGVLPHFAKLGGMQTTARRWFPVGVLVTALLHLAWLDPGAPMWPLQAALIACVGCTAATTLVSDACAAAWRWGQGRQALSGACVCAVVAAVLTVALTKRLGVDPWLAGIAIGMGAVVAWPRWAGVLHALFADLPGAGGPLDPALWWLPKEAGRAVTRRMLQMPAAPREAVHAVLLCAPGEIDAASCPAKLVSAALKERPAVREALVHLAGVHLLAPDSANTHGSVRSRWRRALVDHLQGLPPPPDKVDCAAATAARVAWSLRRLPDPASPLEVAGAARIADMLLPPAVREPLARFHQQLAAIQADKATGTRAALVQEANELLKALSTPPAPSGDAKWALPIVAVLHVAAMLLALAGR